MQKARLRRGFAVKIVPIDPPTTGAFCKLLAIEKRSESTCWTEVIVAYFRFKHCLAVWFLDPIC